MAMKLQRELGEHLPGWRKQMSTELTKLKHALADDNEYLLSHAHPWLRPILCKRNAAMLRELSFIIKSEDVNLAVDLFFGLPMAGAASRPHI